MHVARGDHQVAPAAADIMARTIGARTNRRRSRPGAAQDKTPLYGIPRIGSFPFAGSAIIYWEPGGGLGAGAAAAARQHAEAPGGRPTRRSALHGGRAAAEVRRS